MCNSAHYGRDFTADPSIYIVQQYVYMIHLKMCELCTNGKNCAICKDLCYVHVQKPWRTQIWPRHHSRPLGLIKHRSDNLLHAKLERGFHIFRPSNIRVGSKLYFHSTEFVISVVQGFDPEIKSGVL